MTTFANQLKSEIARIAEKEMRTEIQQLKRAFPHYRCDIAALKGHISAVEATRFDQHKAGIKSNKYAMKYGIRLMPEIYEKLNPMPYGDAQYMEVDLAIRLQQLGYGVWQN